MMTSKIIFRALIGAAALAASTAALANTNLGSGELELNVVDTTANESFTLDLQLNTTTASTGVTVFNQNGNYSFTLSSASDANWSSFVAGEKTGDNIQYDVVSYDGTASAGNLYSTGASLPTVANPQSTMAPGVTALSQYNAAVNLVTSTTTTSALTTGGSSSVPSYLLAFEPSWSGDTGVNDLAVAGTSASFFQFGITNGRSTSPGSQTTLAGTWLLNGAANGSTLTYSAVPLPASWLVLLSGIALLGVIARRRNVGAFSMSGAAAA